MKFLKFLLWVTGIGCLTATPFIFLPWSVVGIISSRFGIGPLPDAPIIVYAFKAAFCVYGLIGVFFIILALNPLKYLPMIFLGAIGLILFGLVALIVGILNGIPLIVFLGDGVYGLLIGILILIFAIIFKKAIES